MDWKQCADDLYNELQKEKKKSERYEEALSFYGNQDNYETVMTEYGDIEYSVNQDFGKLARKAMGIDEQSEETEGE